MHRAATGERKREGHRGLAGKRILGGGQIKPQGGAWGNACTDRRESVRGCSDDDVSVLLLTGGSTSIRQVSIPCASLSENFSLRLKPVIKWTLTGPSFVDLTGSCGDLFVEMCRHGRCGRLWCHRGASLWRVVFGLVGLFDFTRSFPCHPSRIRLVTARLGHPWGGIKTGRVLGFSRCEFQTPITTEQCVLEGRFTQRKAIQKFVMAPLFLVTVLVTVRSRF